MSGGVNLVPTVAGGQQARIVAPSEAEILRRRKLAEVLRSDGGGRGGHPPIHTGGEGALMLANAAVGGLLERQASSREDALRKARVGALYGMMDDQSGMGADQFGALPPEIQQGLALDAYERRNQPGPELSEPYRTPEGHLVQRNARTGKVEVIDRSDLLTPEEMDQKAELQRAGADRTTIDNRGEREEDKRRAQARVERFSALTNNAQETSEALYAIGALDQLLQGVETGAWAGFVNSVREATGVALDDSASDLQAAQALVNYLTPRMRVPGSGATSDMEMRTFARSLPSLMGTPEGNQIAAQTLGGILAYRQSVTDIAERYLTGEFEYGQAMEAVKGLDDPMTLYKEYLGGQPNGGGGAATDWRDYFGEAP